MGITQKTFSRLLSRRAVQSVDGQIWNWDL